MQRLLTRLGTAVRREARLILRALWAGAAGFYNSANLTYASSIAFYSLLSFFPFVLLIFAVLGNLVDADAREAVITWSSRYFPRRFEFIVTQMDAIRSNPVQTGVAGVLILIWASLGVFDAITSAVDHAWGVERGRSFWKHKLFSFLMLMTAGLLLFGAIVAVSVIGVVESMWFAPVLRDAPGLAALRGLGLRLAALLAPALVFGLIFYFVPNARVRIRDVWAAAVLTGLLWRAALYGFSVYVSDITRFTQLHGSIATVVVFLLWVYLSAALLLYGVEFTVAYARLRAAGGK
jgi:membrane protein